MKSGRGGFRENAGRKTGWASGRKFNQTKIVRVPSEFAHEILEIAHKLDAGETINLVTKAQVELSNNFNNKIDLVTKSEEQRLIDTVRASLSKWRQLSNQAKITSPKSERWAKARQMLNELEAIVFEKNDNTKQDIIDSVSKSNTALKNHGVGLVDDLDTSQSEIHRKFSDELDVRTIGQLELLGEFTKAQNNQQVVTINSVAEVELSDISSTNDLVTKSNIRQNDSSEIKPLTRHQLAKRFGISAASLVKRTVTKEIPVFPRWSRKKDPDGISWQYSPDSKLCLPIIENATNSKVLS